MAELLITAHAIQRYRERVKDIPLGEICAHLRSPVFQKALEFGAPFVKLAGGQRAVIADGKVITILPENCHWGTLSLDRDRHYNRGVCDA